MAAVGTFTIQGNVSNLPGGSSSNFGPLTVMSAAAVDNQIQQTLSIGANTITIPTGTTGIVILGPNLVNPTPNPSSAAVLTYKGVTGDTGVVFSASGFTAQTWDAGSAPATVVVSSSAICTITVWMM